MKKLIANLGGTFIYSKEPRKLADWYARNLEIEFEHSEDQKHWFTSYHYKDLASNKKSYVVWSILENKNRPQVNGKVFCINFRVNDLEKVAKKLESNQVDIKGIEDYPQGRFAWITDPDGNQIELWEDTTI